MSVDTQVSWGLKYIKETYGPGNHDENGDPWMTSPYRELIDDYDPMGYDFLVEGELDDSFGDDWDEWDDDPDKDWEPWESDDCE